MSKKFFSQLFRSPLAEMLTLHYQHCRLFFQNQFHWLAEVQVQSEHLYIPPWLCLKVSYWVVPLWNVTSQFTYEAVIHRLCLSTGTVGRYAFHLPSVSHADGIHEIFVCLVHIQSLWLAKLTAKKMPLFPLVLLWVIVTQGWVPLIVHMAVSAFCVLLLTYFCFSCVWYIAGLRGYIQDQVFNCKFCVNLAVILFRILVFIFYLGSFLMICQT